MAGTSTKTTVTVLAGDNDHAGVLEVGYVRMSPRGARAMGPDEPPYDYGADAEAVIGFLARFLPNETWEDVQCLIRERNLA